MSDKQVNPANEPGTTPAERKRIPMTVPMQKLEVSEIPGYHLHWMRGTAGRLAQALRAGYEYVTEDEVTMNNLDLAGDLSKGGSTDMGSKVSVTTGDDAGHDGQPVRLYLMKIREEWWQESQKVVATRSEGIADTFRRGMIGADAGSAADAASRYTKGKLPDLFNPNKRKLVKPS